MMIALFFLIAVFGLSRLFFSAPKQNRRVFFAMDTFFEITSSEEVNWDEIEKDVKSSINQLDLMINSYQPASEISQINQNAGIQPVKVTPDTYLLLQQAIELSQLSKGCFDITFQPLQDLYGFETGDYHVPDLQEIEQAKLLVGYEKIVFNKTDQTVYLPHPGMKINCSGLIKGIVLDRIRLLLSSKGMDFYTLNFGGNLYIQSNKEEKIGIKSPYNNDIVKVIPLKSGFVSTSSNGEQYFIQNEKRYSHIVNPLNGSAESTNDSVTIISNSGLLSDFLSTYLYLLPEEKAEQFISQHYPETGFLIIQNQQISLEKAPEF